MNQVHVVGARPNFIKAAPVIRGLEALGDLPFLVHTGQHYDDQLSKIFFDELEMPHPDVNLGVGSGSHARQTAELMVRLEEVVIDQRPHRVVVYGDINSTLAAALVAAKLEIPVAHVEAGLRSYDRSMPEEINRVMTDSLSDVLFTTSSEAEANLVAEGAKPDSIYFVGNPMIDTLVRFRDRLNVAGATAKNGLSARFGICTLHRPANVDDEEVAMAITEGLARVAEQIPLLIPLHPRGRAALTAAGLERVRGITVCDPLGYLEFMALVSGASLVLTDSGGIQEETTILGVPCLTLRDNTERPVTVTHGTNRLVGRDPDLIARAATEVLANPPTGQTPPLWDGRAGERIAKILRES